MHELIEYLKQFDFFTVLSLGCLVWYFTNEVKKSVEIKIASLDHKIDALDQDMRAMNTRISRMEGTVYGKDIYNQINEKK